MKYNVFAAAILALALIAAAFLISGRYYLLRLDDSSVIRLDRWSGAVKRYDCSVADCVPYATNSDGVPETLETQDLNFIANEAAQNAEDEALRNSN